MKNPDVLQEQLKSFMDISRLPEVRGKKEGEIRIFRDGNSGKAYSWQKGKWNYVGEMMAGPEDSANNTGNEIFGGKKYYKGDRFFSEGNYDFVFDIEDEQGIGRQLPFNLGDNTLIAAEQFLAREQWPVTYKEQVITFLNKHTRPRTNKPRPKQSTQNTQYSHLTPVSRPKGLREQMKFFPVYNKDTFYRKMNAAGMLKMISEHNSTLVDEEFKIKMTDYEIEVLDGMIKELEHFQPTRDLEDRELTILQKKLMTYEGKVALPVIDLIRVLVLHHSSISLLDCLDSGNKFLMYAMRNYSLVKQDPKLGNKFLLTILKILANLFKNNAITFINCQMVIQTFFSEILSVVSKSGLKIILFIIHNLSMYLVLNDKKDFKAKWVLDLLQTMSEIFQDRLLEAVVDTLGNLIYLNDINVSLIKNYGVLLDAVRQAKANGIGNANCVQDVCNTLGI
jgi:phospholipase A-2-activating protein